MTLIECNLKYVNKAVNNSIAEIDIFLVYCEIGF